jgi:hypothetical protein
MLRLSRSDRHSVTLEARLGSFHISVLGSAIPNVLWVFSWSLSPVVESLV